jgi:replicative DNA helicase
VAGVTVTDLADRSRADGDDLTPPHDIAAEQSALGGMLLSRDAIDDVLGILQERDFYRPAHQLVFAAASEMRDAGAPVDAVTIAAELTRRGDIVRTGGYPYLHTLIEAVPTAANAGYYARIVREHAVRRRVIEAATRAIQLGYQGDGTAGEIADRATAEMTDAVSGVAPEKTRSAEEIFWDVINAAERGERRGMTTGLTDLDCVFSLDNGEFDIVAADTSVGKSVLGLNLAAHVALRLGRPVYYWTGEMSADLCMARLISAEARVNLSRLLDGTLSDEELARAVAQAEPIAAAPLRIDDTPMVPQSHIRTRLRQMERAGDPAALAVIDHMGLLSVPKAESYQLAIAAISAGFQGMAREFDIPLVGLHQLKRRPAHKPTLEDLRDTGRLAQDAVRVILLYREDMHERESPRAGEIDLIVAKNRNGPLTTITEAFQGQHSRIVDMAPAAWSASGKWAQ